MKITIEVQDATRKMFLHEQGEEGHYGPHKIKTSTIIPDGSPLIAVDDKRYYISMNEIAQAVADVHIAQLEKEKEAARAGGE